MTSSKRLTTLYIKDSLRDAIRKVAEKNNRSMNAQVTHILENDSEIKTAIKEAAK